MTKNDVFYVLHDKDFTKSHARMIKKGENRDE